MYSEPEPSATTASNHKDVSMRDTDRPVVEIKKRIGASSERDLYLGQPSRRCAALADPLAGGDDQLPLGRIPSDADALDLCGMLDKSKLAAALIFDLPSSARGQSAKHRSGTVDGAPIDKSWLAERAGAILPRIASKSGGDAMSSGNPNAHELATQLQLHRVGREWRGACPVCGYAGSFALTDGKYAPIGWCANGCDQTAIAQALGSRHNGLAHAPQGKDARAIKDRLERAERIWRGSEPVSDTAGAAYLDVRGIAHLVTCPDLRFRLDCPHPSGTSEHPVRLPALIAAVRDVDGRFVGIHRTYLRRDGSGKDEIEPAKASLGPVHGGAVRLARKSHTIE
jgi:hypothetical protein